MVKKTLGQSDLSFFFILNISKMDWCLTPIFFIWLEIKDTRNAFDNFMNKQKIIGSNVFQYVKVYVF